MASNPPVVWNMNGTNLTLAGLAVIADTLEKNGSVTVLNAVTDPEAPIVKALGFKIVHIQAEGQYLTSAEKI